MKRRKPYILLLVIFLMVAGSAVYVLRLDPDRDSRKQLHDACTQIKAVLNADPNYCLIAYGQQATDPNTVYVTVLTETRFRAYGWAKPIYPHIRYLIRSPFRRLVGRETDSCVRVLARNVTSDDFFRLKEKVDKNMHNSNVPVEFYAAAPLKK